MVIKIKLIKLALIIIFCDPFKDNGDGDGCGRWSVGYDGRASLVWTPSWASFFLHNIIMVVDVIIVMSLLLVMQFLLNCITKIGKLFAFFLEYYWCWSHKLCGF